MVGKRGGKSKRFVNRPKKPNEQEIFHERIEQGRCWPYCFSARVFCLVNIQWRASFSPYVTTNDDRELVALPATA